jgi:hypothetical protein
MSEDKQGNMDQEGQASVAPEIQGHTPETEHNAIQSEQAQSTQTAATEQSFTDFNSLPEDVRSQLEPFYKAMQGDYTRKTQKLSKKEKEMMQKIQAYDQFTANPLHNLTQLAQQYGYQMLPAGVQKQMEKEHGVPQDWTPNTWEEVFTKSQEYLTPKIKEMLTPYQQEIANLKAELGQHRASKVEAQFNQIDPNWRQYEDEMRELLQEHPSLAKDPFKLYKLAVPEDVFKARATQEAMKSLEAKTKAARIESSGRHQQSNPVKNERMSFDEAFRLAKQQLGRK